MTTHQASYAGWVTTPVCVWCARPVADRYVLGPHGVEHPEEMRCWQLNPDLEGSMSSTEDRAVRVALDRQAASLEQLAEQITRMVDAFVAAVQAFAPIAVAATQNMTRWAEEFGKAAGQAAGNALRSQEFSKLDTHE